MATTATPTYRAYQPPATGSRFGYSNEGDPRKLASNQRAVVQSTGDNLMTGDEQLANQYADQASGVEQYLDPIQSNLAAGNGGYNPAEANQIQLSQADKNQIEWSPQDVQNLVDKAGISAGQQTAASVGAAERAAAASGGSPAALATYRARAAQTGAANAANAETEARVAGKQAQAQGAATAQQLQSAGGQAVGNARIGQQNEGLGYYNGLQQEKNSNALSEQGLQQGAYGTQTSGTGDAAKLGVTASQTPSTADKIIGGIAGAASAFLADGEMGVLDPEGQDAVVGENGTEAVIDNAPQAVQRGASDPVRGNTRFMGNGDYGGETANPSFSAASPDTITEIDPNQQYGAAQPAVKQPNFLQTYLAKARQSPQSPQSGGDQPWNKTTPYQQAGSAIGTGIGVLAAHLADGSAGDQPWWKDLVTHESENFLHNSVPALFADGSAGGGIGNYLADGDDPWTDQGVSMMADGAPQQSADDFRRQASAAVIREAKGENPGKGGWQYSDSDTYRSLANIADPHTPEQRLMMTTTHTPEQRLMMTMTRQGTPSNPYTQKQLPYAPAHQRSTPALPYVPQRPALPYVPTPHMADGHVPNGVQVGRAQVFNKPTAVRLKPSESVIPLGYRAKAKVRPSAAMPAMTGAPRAA